MFYEVSGDILHTEAQAIAHGVAPNDDFAQGLALALRERWPAMAKDFRNYCRQNHPKPGEAWSWGGPGGVRIVNLMTQEGAYDHGSRPGKATVAHVNHCLRALRKEIEENGFESVAMPKLATGVGGLEWSDVEPLIREQLGDLDVRFYLYTTYVAGEKANETAAKAT